jgi:hypothetical protein
MCHTQTPAATLKRDAVPPTSPPSGKVNGSVHTELTCKNSEPEVADSKYAGFATCLMYPMCNPYLQRSRNRKLLKLVQSSSEEGTTPAPAAAAAVAQLTGEITLPAHCTSSTRQLNSTALVSRCTFHSSIRFVPAAQAHSQPTVIISSTWCSSLLQSPWLPPALAASPGLQPQPQEQGTQTPRAALPTQAMQMQASLASRPHGPPHSRSARTTPTGSCAHCATMPARLSHQSRRSATSRPT